jgi:hypothetical protein
MWILLIERSMFINQISLGTHKSIEFTELAAPLFTFLNSFQQDKCFCFQPFISNKSIKRHSSHLSGVVVSVLATGSNPAGAMDF